MIKDFENWYEKTYHKKVKVEYSLLEQMKICIIS